MFTVEYVVDDEGRTADVLERMVLGHPRLPDANTAARSFLSGVQARWPATPPNGYVILDKENRVVIRYRQVI
jgi:hypothetical protein